MGLYVDQMELEGTVELALLVNLVSVDNVDVTEIVQPDSAEQMPVEPTAVNVSPVKLVSMESVQEHVLLNVLDK
jgi:hypothetical protein